MNFQGAIGFLIVGFTMMAAVFLVAWGAMNDQPALITVGVSILSTAFGTVMGYFFPDVMKKYKERKR